jgi:nuclear mRNA export protein SAC3
MILLSSPTDISVEIPVDLEAPAHLGAAYASGPFLDACLKLPVSRAEEALGDNLQGIYVIPRPELEESKQRFEQVLQGTSDHLRRLAAVSLSSRSQKRPAAEESVDGSPTSTNKRFRLSISPVSTERVLDEPDEPQLNGFHTPPPPSTSASTTVLSDAPHKPQVTIAMLRALAQGVLKSSK